MRNVAVDAVILRDNMILLVKRKNPPFQGYWALPGGIVEDNETVQDALVREVLEETGYEIQPMVLIGVFSSPDRDPRGNVSVAFLSTIVGGNGTAGSDALELDWFSLDKMPRLAFDHSHIVKSALEYLRFINHIGEKTTCEEALRRFKDL